MSSHQPPADSPVDAFLTVREVAELYSVSAHAVHRMARRGELPQPIKLGPRTTRWKASDILAHLDSVQHARPARLNIKPAQ